MEKYSETDCEMHSQFKEREAHQVEKYIGRLINFYDNKLEVAGHNHNQLTDEPLLIVDVLQIGGPVGAGASRRDVQKL